MVSTQLVILEKVTHVPQYAAPQIHAFLNHDMSLGSTRPSSSATAR